MAETPTLDSDLFSAGRPQVGLVFQETFAPILYVMKYSIFDDVLKDHTAVGARLASSIFTLDMQEPERFLSADRSDCGIANIDIGAVFGGEKETGSGRGLILTHGNPTCAGQPIPSITRGIFHLRRAWHSRSSKIWPKRLWEERA
jgi:hypothetical protein